MAKKKARKKKTPARKAPRRRRRNPAKYRAAYRTSMPLYVLYARKAQGPKMHFDGDKFSTNGKGMRFTTTASAHAIGRLLLDKYPILKTYVISVEPIKAGK